MDDHCLHQTIALHNQSQFCMDQYYCDGHIVKQHGYYNVYAVIALPK